MNCLVCGKPFSKEQKYIGDKYKRYSFCSKKCYDEYITKRDGDKPSPTKETNGRELTDWIKAQAPYYPHNWPFINKQINNLIAKYNTSRAEILEVCKYAVDICGYTYNPEYSPAQVIHRFLESYRQFIYSVEAQENEPAQSIEPIYITPSKSRKFMKDIDFD